jgi:hypothetical protein
MEFYVQAQAPGVDFGPGLLDGGMFKMDAFTSRLLHLFVNGAGEGNRTLVIIPLIRRQGGFVSSNFAQPK